MTTSALITDFLGEGTAAARPVTLTITSKAVGIYYATDTKVFSLWNGASWDAYTLGTTGQPGALNFSWGATVTVAADTYILTLAAPYAGTITSLQATVGGSGGTLTETVRIAGVAVGGINAVSVTSASVQSFTATSANTFVTGNKIDVVVSIAAGAPAGAAGSVLFTKA